MSHLLHNRNGNLLTNKEDILLRQVEVEDRYFRGLVERQPKLNMSTAQKRKLLNCENCRRITLIKTAINDLEIQKMDTMTMAKMMSTVGIQNGTYETETHKFIYKALSNYNQVIKNRENKFQENMHNF